VSQLQLNKNAKLSLFAGLLGCGQTALLICLPALSANTGLNTAQLGTVVALGSGIFLIGNPLWGYLSDRWSRKGALLVGLLGYATCFVIMAFSASQLSPLSSETVFLLLLTARLIYGLTASAIYPTIQAWTLDELESGAEQGHKKTDSDQESKALTRLAAAVNAGRLIGPIIAAPLLVIGPSSVLFLLAILALLLTLILTSISTSNTPHTNDKTQTTQLNWRLMTVAVMVTTILGAIQYSLGFLLLQHFNTSTEAGVATAFIFVFTTLVVIALQIGVISKLTHLWPNAVLVACGGLIIGCLLLFASTLLTLVSAIVMISSASATLASAYQSEAARTSTGRGHTVGMFGMAHAMGGSLGVWLAGWLLVRTDSSIFIAITAIALIVPVLVLPVCLTYYRRAT